jgi:inward rectifier potassium channel
MTMDHHTSGPGDKPRARVRKSRSPERGRVRKIDGGTRIVVAHGMPIPLWHDLYHRALVASWPVFFAALAVLFLLLNLSFATLYQLGNAAIANQAPAGFTGAFFFSVETLATVGYGDMHPQTIYAHAVSTLEIFIGMSGIALATGLIFARFSRPRAKIMFSRYVVVRPIDGKMTLMMRAANGRLNVIAEARANLRMMRMETSVEGFTLRRIHDLKLVRDQHPIFLLGWILMHVIDKDSPLFGATPDTLAAEQASLLITINGSDEATSQTMQARHSWGWDAIRWQYRYADMIVETDGISHVDYEQFDEVIPLTASESALP